MMKKMEMEMEMELETIHIIERKTIGTIVTKLKKHILIGMLATKN